ncbi:MAG: alanine:cation symporter family protein [Bacteroidales bacterium]|nr:alanine:cation symporter family protein [Bacteroidales bacterium]
MSFAEVVSQISKIIWSAPLIVLLIFAGLFFTVGTRFVQVRHFKDMLKSLFAVKAGQGKGISSFQAFCMALSGRIGTGNIVGVATAIAIGGPGSVFWMWLIAFFGAATAFMESSLAQKYRYQHESGFRGGPFAYIESGLKQKWMGICFAVAGVVGYGVLLVTVQANGIGSSMSNAFSVPPLYAGIGLAVILAIVIFGGVKSISRVCSIITPFMALGYIIISLIVIGHNIGAVPGVFKQIFEGAFGIGAIGGGALGTTIMMGVKRGIFSNEAGQGNGAIVSASADVSHPAKQGFAQSFSVYVDTLFVCTATALMILIAAPQDMGNNFAGYTQAAIDTVFPGFGSAFVSIAMVFFVYTTVMAYYYYAESSLLFLIRKHEGTTLEKILINVLRVALLAAAVMGTVYESTVTWDLGDIAVGLQAWVNVIALLLLSRQGFKILRDYEQGV